MQCQAGLKQLLDAEVVLQGTEWKLLERSRYRGQQWRQYGRHGHLLFVSADPAEAMALFVPICFDIFSRMVEKNN
jgi:hypothetical protein